MDLDREATLGVYSIWKRRRRRDRECRGMAASNSGWRSTRSRNLR